MSNKNHRKFNCMEGYFARIGEEDRIIANRRAWRLHAEASALLATGHDPTRHDRKIVQLRELFPCLGDSVSIPTSVEEGKSFGQSLGQAWLCRADLSRNIERHQQRLCSFFLSLGREIALAVVVELSKFRTALSQSRWAFDLINDLRIRLEIKPLNPAAYGY